MSRTSKTPSLWLLGLLFCAQPVATDLYLPALPLLERDFAGASSTLTLFTLFYGLAQVWAGHAVDRYGRRAALLGGMALYTLCSVASVLAPSMWLLLAVRSVQGISVALVVVAARAAIRDLYPPLEGPKAMARIHMRTAVVVILCPLIGAWFATHTTWRMTLATNIVFGVLLWVWLYRQFPETKPVQDTSVDTPSGDDPSTWQLLRGLWRNPSFRAWTLLGSFTTSAIFTFLTVSSHIYIEHLGFSPAQYGVSVACFASMFLMSNVIASRLFKHWSVFTVARLGVTLGVLGCLVQVFAGLIKGQMGEVSGALPLLMLGHALFVMAHGFVQACSFGSAMRDFAHMAGRASAWSGLTMLLCAFVVSQSAALALTKHHDWGVWPLVATNMLCMLVALAITLTLVPQAKRSVLAQDQAI